MFEKLNTKHCKKTVNTNFVISTATISHFAFTPMSNRQNQNNSAKTYLRTSLKAFFRPAKTSASHENSTKTALLTEKKNIVADFRGRKTI